MTINNKNIDNVFYIFVTAHLIFWTLIPSITNHNLPLDTIEALAWGSNLDWGFNKHPPMSAFVPEIFFQIFGSQDWAYYLLSQIFVIISFYYVFKFSNEIFYNKVLALISVLLIEAIYFYNFTTPEFNVNVCQLPFWSLALILFRELIISSLRNLTKDGLPASQLGKFKTFFFFISIITFFLPLKISFLNNFALVFYWIGFILTLVTLLGYLRIKKNII